MMSIEKYYLSEFVGILLGVLILILVWYLYGSYIRRVCCSCSKSNDSNA
ncbi:unnamed protein product [Arabidopsis halleri]